MDELKKIETGIAEMRKLRTGEKEAAQEQNGPDEAFKSGTIQYIDSREVAQVVEKTHGHLARDIGRYIKELTQSNFGFTDFFVESSYQDASGKRNKCYLITKKGCEFIAHKLTGIKGTKFSATYINRFHEMEDALSAQAISELQKFMEQQAEARMLREKLDTMILDRIETLETMSERNGTEQNPFRIRRDVVKRRMEILNEMVDKVAGLCGMDRNRVLHRMYEKLQEHFGMSLNPYLSVMRAENPEGWISSLHVVASVDRFYEAAVDMNRCVIERKTLYG